MCGINGIVSFSEKPRKDKLLSSIRAMNDRLSHRGPDDFGELAFEEANMAFGHRRLSIQDLSAAGHQPMNSGNGRYTIVFNGEIYNFKKLKQSLLNKGSTFRTETDTEVILALLEQYKLDKTLTLLDGMFAFALYDRELNTLTLCRDRIGEKPLYFYSNQEFFIFSSELSALLVGANKKHLISDIGLSSYLHFGYIPGRYTILENIFKLTPGTYIQISLTKKLSYQENLAECSYLTQAPEPPEANPPLDNIAKLTNTLDELIQSSVNQQSISDVKLGAFLSGGIDSSLVTSVLQSQSDTPIETFTIGFKQKEYDESPHARDIANHIGAKSNTFYINNDDLLDNVFPTLNAFDEPFANSSAVASFILSKEAKKEVTVCLSGDGGDELFMGYNRYLPAHKLHNKLHTFPSFLQTSLSIAASSLSILPLDKWMNTFTKLSGKKSAVNYNIKLRKLSSLSKIPNKQILYRYLTGYFDIDKPPLLGGEKIDYVNDFFQNSNFEHDYIASAMLWDQLNYLPGDCLYKTDRTSMANSLEVRVPLLSKSIVQFSRAIPSDFFSHQQKSKLLLRQVLEKYIPSALFERPKMGFTVPIDSWVNEELANEINSLLAPKLISEQQIFDSASVQDLISKHNSGKHLQGSQIWSLYCFQYWLQQNEQWVDFRA
ncbi:MAG: asparagine synthase (glutamine-hydrolyzing) [Cellvibrionaceae bacterium]